MIDITIKVSDQEKKLTRKMLSYSEDLLLSRENKVLETLVQEMIKEFGAAPEDVLVTCRMTW